MGDSSDVAFIAIVCLVLCVIPFPAHIIPVCRGMGWMPVIIVAAANVFAHFLLYVMWQRWKKKTGQENLKYYDDFIDSVYFTIGTLATLVHLVLIPTFVVFMIQIFMIASTLVWLGPASFLSVLFFVLVTTFARIFIGARYLFMRSDDSRFQRARRTGISRYGEKTMSVDF